MTNWIKYDGTNKPDDNVLVRVKEPSWESPKFRPAAEYCWDEKYNGQPVTHFQLKDKEND